MGSADGGRAGRHAFLIMAHRDQYVLDRLLRMIDHPRHDIFLHVDRQARSIDIPGALAQVREATIQAVPRMKVSWGDYSQVKATLRLLRIASATPHDYYHLLSGADLPLASPPVMHEFFRERAGREFIHFNTQNHEVKHVSRVNRYHLLTGSRVAQVAAKRGRTWRVWRKLDAEFVKLQERSGKGPFVGRDAQPRVGSQWFSITHELARYAVAREAWIARAFRFTVFPDEWFLQTLVETSPFKNDLYLPGPLDDYRASARWVDWERGYPYTWRMADADALLGGAKRGFMFARKFDSQVDREVVDAIFEGVG